MQANITTSPQESIFRHKVAPSVHAIQFKVSDEPRIDIVVKGTNGFLHPKYAVYPKEMPGSFIEVNDTDWIVTYENGSVSVIKDKDFNDKFVIAE